MTEPAFNSYETLRQYIRGYGTRRIATSDEQPTLLSGKKVSDEFRRRAADADEPSGAPGPASRCGGLLPN